MSDNVTLTASMRSNLLTLQNTTEDIGKVQNILATGKKVNSALDDPTAFFSAQSLNNRADDLNGLLDGMGQSVQTLQAADDGISAITDIVDQMESVAQSAKDSIEDQAGAVLSEAVTGTSATNAVTGLGLAADDDITFTTTTGGTVSVTVTAADTMGTLATKISGLDGVKASVVEGATAGTVQLKVEAEESDESLTVTNGIAGTVATFGFTTVESGATVTSATAVASYESPGDLSTLEESYDDLKSQLNDLIEDAGYRGTNLLNGQDLITTFNEDGSSEYTVQGQEYKTDAAGTRLAISDADFSDLTHIDAALDEIDVSLTNLRADSKTYGNALAVVQTREDFTENVVSNLQEGSDKLTLADSNEESAKLLSLQTSQSLGVNALSLASDTQSSVLQLFQ